MRLADLRTIRDGITGKRSPINTDDKRRQQPISASALDEAVFAALPQIDPRGIGYIMSITRAKRASVESALKRLVAAGKVTRSGVARGTVYARAEA